MALIGVRSEVKGDLVRDGAPLHSVEHGRGVFERYTAALPGGIRAERDRARRVAVVPGDAAARRAAVFHEVVTGGDDEAFSRAMERCAVLGMHWFVQMLVSVATPAHLLRLMPATLRLTRRGPVRVTVADGRAMRDAALHGQPYAVRPPLPPRHSGHRARPSGPVRRADAPRAHLSHYD